MTTAFSETHTHGDSSDDSMAAESVCTTCRGPLVEDGDAYAQAKQLAGTSIPIATVTPAPVVLAQAQPCLGAGRLLADGPPQASGLLGRSLPLLI